LSETGGKRFTTPFPSYKEHAFTTEDLELNSDLELRGQDLSKLTENRSSFNLKRILAFLLPKIRAQDLWILCSQHRHFEAGLAPSM